jgi:hypothetical protein
MKLEDQVVNFALSDLLKKIGAKQESLFCYQTMQDSEPSVFPRQFNLNEFTKPSKDDRIAAFTVAELGEMLPECTFSWKVNVDPKWLCSYEEPSVEDAGRADTEANARAKLLIHLIENKMIEV